MRLSATLYWNLRCAVWGMFHWFCCWILRRSVASVSVAMATGLCFSCTRSKKNKETSSFQLFLDVIFPFADQVHHKRLQVSFSYRFYGADGQESTFCPPALWIETKFPNVNNNMQRVHKAQGNNFHEKRKDSVLNSTLPTLQSCMKYEPMIIQKHFCSFQLVFVPMWSGLRR